MSDVRTVKGPQDVKILVTLTTISWHQRGQKPLRSGLKREKMGAVNADDFSKQFQWAGGVAGRECVVKMGEMRALGTQMGMKQ